MQQIREILAQLSLQLELSIAMCDKIEEQNKRLDRMEPALKALETRVNGLSTRISEMGYAAASKAYEARTGRPPIK